MTRQRFSDLLDRFLSGASTPDENRLIDEYVNRLETGTSTNSTLSEEDSLKQLIWQQIKSKTLDQYAVVRLPWYRRPLLRIAAVAASVILVVVTLSVYFKTAEPVQTPLAAKPVQPESPISALRHLSNTTGKTMSIQLPDSSVVELDNKGELTYKEPFIDDRQVMLSGEANFEVTKNKTKPFRVISKAISTTALGTRFTVAAKDNEEKITVRLYDGAVVIKAINAGDWRLKKDFYLKPGQEFIYTTTALARVRRFSGSTKAAMLVEDEATDDPLIPQNVSGSWYMFNNQALANVFDQLAFTYNVQIVYEKKDLRNKFFVGRFNKTDSLDIILKYISVANELTVRKEENTYYITR